MEHTPHNTSPDLLSVAEFCERNGISRPFFYKLAAQGKGPKVIKLGKRTLISREAAAQWRQRMEQDTQGAA
jgi:excisionase family DNA binding protein